VHEQEKKKRIQESTDRKSNKSRNRIGEEEKVEK
jgi:hypothetical protein